MKKQDGYAILFMVIIIMMLVSIVLFSMFIISSYEFQSIQNYSHYQKAHHLALGARAEVLSNLSSNWDALGNSSSRVVANGEYGYELVESTGSRKKIKIYGKSGLIQRNFEGVFEASSRHINLLDLKKYVLYCDGKMLIENIDNIYALSPSSGIIGITKDLLVNKSHGFKNPSLDVKGDTVVVKTNNGSALYNSFIDSQLPYCQAYNSNDYIKWLVENFKDNVVFISAPGQAVYLNKDTFNVEDNAIKIYIVQDANSFVIDDCAFEGILVLNRVQKVYMTSSVSLYGSMLLFGGDTEVTNIQGQIRGNLMLLDVKKEAYFGGLLEYDLEELEKITPYLSTNLLNKKPKSEINLLSWREG